MIVNYPERLASARLLLSRPTVADLPDLVAMHTSPEVMATLGGLRTAEELAALHDRFFAAWVRDGFGWWILRTKEDGRFVGRGGLRRIPIGGANEIELGYGLMPEFWGQELALELAKESVRIGFEVAGFDDIVCFTLPTNHRSRRVMEKAGFVYERDVEWSGSPHVFFRIRKS